MNYSPDPAFMAGNLVNVFDAVQAVDLDVFNAGLNWYNDAHTFCALTAVEYNKPIDHVVGIVAALSPAAAWEKNKQDAVAILQHGSEATVGTYGNNKNKAVAIAENGHPLDILGGNKVLSFYHNILKPESADHVTIDRHAIRAAVGDFDTPADTLVRYAYTDKRYHNMASAYFLAAEKRNTLPLQLQAVVWLAVRGEQKYFYQ